MRSFHVLPAALGSAFALLAGTSALAADDALPRGITISQTDAGAVYADSNGMTLYAGNQGRRGGARNDGSGCTATQYKIGRGGGGGDSGPFSLPLESNRPTCVQKNPPMLADAQSKPVGKWSLVARPDGAQQWAYEGRPLYRSVKDVAPGDLNGERSPAFVEVPVVPGIALRRTAVGQFLETPQGMALYTHDLDKSGRSQCEDECAQTWKPFHAGALAKPSAENWSVVTRRDGSKQWAFKGKPLYTYVDDLVAGHRNGEGERHWRIARVNEGVGTPAEITRRVTWAGEVFTDARGHTIYYYSCRDASPESISCDDPTDRSSDWFASCGEPERCATIYKPVIAPANAKPVGRTWTVVTIPRPWAPVRTAGEASDGIRVWAYKGRPVFTFVDDEAPAKFNAFGIQASGFTWHAFGPVGGIDVQAKN